MNVGDYLMPERGNAGSVIQVLEVLEQGYRFRRVNISYNGEEFFLTRKAFESGHWIPVPNGTQLRFL